MCLDIAKSAAIKTDAQRQSLRGKWKQITLDRLLRKAQRAQVARSV
jgi:hypothetical protein